VGLTGSSGLIGKALRAELTRQGFRVRCFVRRPPHTPDEIQWDPRHGELPFVDDGQLSSIINLAGEPILGRWTQAKKARIRESRVTGTTLLANWISKLDRPCTLISASAIGIYGVTADDPHHEQSPFGSGFLAEVCKAWEQAADPARQSGQRVVHPRIGLVLDTNGGALQKMLPAFRMGLGGPVGSGNQWTSWITLDDVVSIFMRCLKDTQLIGAVNCVAPTPVQNKTFTQTLAKHLKRPAYFTVPKFSLRLLLGEMAEQTLLASQRVEPRALSQRDHVFKSPTLDDAFKALLS
jgi:uncharacterized protein (TIGR01777 family)